MQAVGGYWACGIVTRLRGTHEPIKMLALSLPKAFPQTFSGWCGLPGRKKLAHGCANQRINQSRSNIQAKLLLAGVWGQVKVSRGRRAAKQHAGGARWQMVVGRAPPTHTPNRGDDRNETVQLWSMKRLSIRNEVHN
uniref:Uncharacterized protein n=1 Tax=Eutreptiella gymnastica TaxID=73025 RepID=A0A7S1J9T0_9EUGL|mmetsp:Transcript_78009/g.137592  ORF Transcript_78009/g.137592 Transcript_78009/m.137592 type:complete len:137 (+) Transcript_78009:149-559(+)